MGSHYCLFPQSSCLIKCTIWMLLQLETATQCFHPVSCIFCACLHCLLLSANCIRLRSENPDVSVPVTLALSGFSSFRNLYFRTSGRFHSCFRGGTNLQSLSLSPCGQLVIAACAVCSTQWPCELFVRGDKGRAPLAHSLRVSEPLVMEQLQSPFSYWRGHS